MPDFKLTEAQHSAMKVMSSDASHCLLEGGSRSGKTLLHVRNTCIRALKAPASRHAILRFRFNHVKQSIVLDTFPKVMSLCWPEAKYRLDKSDWYAELGNGSQIWFGGLDDKERTEKILGLEFATIYLNECSQIPVSSWEIVKTRLAQRVAQRWDTEKGKKAEASGKLLKPRMFYDWNPTNKAHWCHKLFHLGLDPTDNRPLRNPEDYVFFKINPQDNAENLSPEYLGQLAGLSARMRKRFLEGEAADALSNQLFSDADIDKWRVIDASNLPDMIKVVVGIDPSGSQDEDNASNDEIGIAVGGLGADGNAYLLEDCTVKAGPKTWGTVACGAFDRHEADTMVAEVNYGGAMVQYVIETQRPRTPFNAVHATRGKHVRAEPFSALYEDGKVRHVGYYPELEAELTAFSTTGYQGTSSPNRADAWIWVLAELFPSMVRDSRKLPRHGSAAADESALSWMAN